MKRRLSFVVVSRIRLGSLLRNVLHCVQIPMPEMSKYLHRKVLLVLKMQHRYTYSRNHEPPVHSVRAKIYMMKERYFPYLWKYCTRDILHLP